MVSHRASPPLASASEPASARSARPAKAFTLVELLVVVGIIALLISILLPALNSARTQAKKVACLSNMRQTILGLQIYAAQFRDYPWNVDPAYDIRGIVFNEHSGQIYHTPAEVLVNPNNASFTDPTRSFHYQVDGQCERPWWMYYLLQSRALLTYKAAGCAFEVPEGWEIEYIRQLGGFNFAPYDKYLPMTSDEWRRYPGYTYVGPGVIDDVRVGAYTGGQLAYDGYEPGGNGNRSGCHYPHANTKRRAIILYCSVWSIGPYDGRDNYLAPHGGPKSWRNRMGPPMSGGSAKWFHWLSESVGFTDGSAMCVQQPNNSNAAWWVNERGDVSQDTNAYQLSPN